MSDSNATQQPGDRRVRYRVRAAESSDVDSAAAVLAAAFIGYPWTSWTVDPRDHGTRLRELYRMVLGELVLPYGASWVAEQHAEAGPSLVGVAGWLTPRSDPPAELWQTLAAVEQRRRGDRWEQHLRAEAQLEDLRPSEPHWLLGTVGVLPQHRGQGIARRLLAPGLEAAAAEGVEAHLETSSLLNVGLYRRLGFTVTATVEIVEGGPTVWLMRRGDT